MLLLKGTRGFKTITGTTGEIGEEVTHPHSTLETETTMVTTLVNDKHTDNSMELKVPIMVRDMDMDMDEFIPTDSSITNKCIRILVNSTSSNNKDTVPKEIKEGIQEDTNISSSKDTNNKDTVGTD